jgi:hypothetical protein
MFELYMLIREIILYLIKLIVCIVSFVVTHAAKISVVLNLGVGFFSLNLLFKVEELSKRVSFVLQKYEAKFAEKALETPLVVQESIPGINPYLFKPIILALFFVMMYLMYITNNPPKEDSAAIHAKFWSNHLRKSTNSRSIPKVETDNIQVESASNMSHEPALVESTPTDSLASISETLSGSVTPELVASVIENLPV